MQRAQSVATGVRPGPTVRRQMFFPTAKYRRECRFTAAASDGQRPPVAGPTSLAGIEELARPKRFELLTPRFVGRRTARKVPCLRAFSKARQAEKRGYLGKSDNQNDNRMFRKRSYMNVRTFFSGERHARREIGQ